MKVDEATMRRTISKNIAAYRKAHHDTQLDLAEKLNYSDKSVSKWERGKSMPDASIMLELCDLLGISVNELLTGEHIAMENYKEKAEENLLELQEKKSRAQKSLLRVELVWLAITLLLIPVHLAINYYYPENTGTGIGPLIAVIGLVMFAIYFFRYYEIRLK